MTTIYNIESLIQELKHGKVKYLFFWGHTPKDPAIVDKACFSQWYPAPFVEDQITYPTAEHYMMAKKAELFHDLAIRDQIIQQAHPNQAKALGRKVRNFDNKIWDAHKLAIVQQGSYLKFSQHAALKDYLLQTGDRILVEASPYDKVWGIGMAQDHPHAEQPARWRGENLLGFALMAARDRLKQHANMS